MIETYHGLITNEILLQSVNTYFLLMFTTRNGLFFGVLFVALGMALRSTGWKQSAIRLPRRLRRLGCWSSKRLPCVTSTGHWITNTLNDRAVYLYWFAGLLRTRLD
ncbi:MAG: hypothetical protein ACLVJ6_07655 [Merdibacter sp.]